MSKEVREQRLPFDRYMKAPNNETMAAMEDIIHRRNLSKSFDSTDDLFAALEEDDVKEA